MDLNESEKLNNPAMQSLAAGKGFSAAMEAAPGLVPADANKINVIKLPRRVRRFWALTGAELLKLSAAHAAMLGDRLLSPAVRGGDPRVKVRDEPWKVVTATGHTAGKSYSAIEAFQQTRYAVLGGIALPAVEQAIDVSQV